jgi:hypothetical protein
MGGTYDRSTLEERTSKALIDEMPSGETVYGGERVVEEEDLGFRVATAS